MLMKNKLRTMRLKVDGNKLLKELLSLKSPRLRSKGKRRWRVLAMREIQMTRLKLQSNGLSMNGPVRNSMISEPYYLSIYI